MSEPGNVALASAASTQRNINILFGLTAFQLVAYDLAYLD
jgi:hypothetical protein